MSNRCNRANVSEVHQLSTVWQKLVVVRADGVKTDSYYCFTNPKNGKSGLYRSLKEVAKDNSIDGQHLKELEEALKKGKSGGKARGRSPAPRKSPKIDKATRRSKSPKRAKSPKRSKSPKFELPSESQRTVTDGIMELMRSKAKKPEWEQWVNAYVHKRGSEFGSQTESQAAAVLGLDRKSLDVDKILTAYVKAVNEKVAFLQNKYPKGTKRGILMRTPAVEAIGNAAVNLLYRQFLANAKQ